MHHRAARLLRTRSALCALATLLSLTLSFAGTAAAPARAASRLDSVERRVIRLVNANRASFGLRPLTPNRRLSRSADSHSRDMARRNFFAHASSNGSPMESRVRRYTRAARLGENLAYLPRVQRRQIAEAIVGMWMTSPAHRAVILSPGFRRIGVARRRGVLGNTWANVFTADFSSQR